MGQAKSVPSDGSYFVPTVSLTPDGRIVAVGCNNQIDIFEVKLGAPLSHISPSWTIPSGITSHLSVKTHLKTSY